MASPAEILRQVEPNIDRVSHAPMVNRVPVIGAKVGSWIIGKVRDHVESKFKKSGITLTAHELASITAKDGIVSSPFFGEFEEALGLPRDNKWDLQLEIALKNPVIIKTLKQHFHRFSLLEQESPVALAQQEPIEHGVPRILDKSAQTRAL